MNTSSLASVSHLRVPVFTLILVGLALIGSTVPSGGDYLQFERSAIAHGAVWRICTSHFVHWSLDHLFWDALALGVLGWLCEGESGRRYLGCLAVSAVLIPLAIFIAEPQVVTYRGLSGLDSALLLMLAARIIVESVAAGDRWRCGLACAVVLGFAAKTGFELATGQTLFVDSASAGFTPLPVAHVVGGLVGAAFGLIDVGGNARQLGKADLLRGGDDRKRPTPKAKCKRRSRQPRKANVLTRRPVDREARRVHAG